MKWLSAGLTFVNVATVCALLSGMLFGGLGMTIAAISFEIALVVAVIAWFKTSDIHLAKERLPNESLAFNTQRIFFWFVAACFAFFAFRCFCWLLFIDGNQLKVQSPNNLGDLALHITYVKNFASGVPLWPENPIHAFSNMRYPAGTDLFNALLVLLRIDMTKGFIWAGLLGSFATFYALYRWGGSFTVAGFLFNGGLAGFAFLQTWKFIDYQGDKTIAWKSLPLAMLVTQRGLLYALPAGLLLLCQWRAKYSQGAALSRPPQIEKRGGRERATPHPPLPLWLEVMLYASMPLFHLHTFIALSIVAAFLFVVGDMTARKELGIVAGVAFLPATYFVWTITDHFRARSLLAWHPGWVQKSDDFARPFFSFWIYNFGLLVPLVLLLIGFSVWRAQKSRRLRTDPALVFLAPAALLFLFAFFVKTAPWEWDNIKLIIWAYLIALPFLWSELLARWSIPVRAAICLAIFFSGFVSLFGGLIGKENGYTLAERAELDSLASAIRKLPPTARFAAYPTYNHPLLLQGRKVVLGYLGHLWTQGFDYTDANARLESLLRGAPDWREQARQLHARYIFWGREEKAHYGTSTKPWERQAQLVMSGSWGAIYDLEHSPAPAAAGE